MNITEVQYEERKLILCTDDVIAAKRFCYTFKPGNYEVRAERIKRSRNANAYAWTLMGQIAEKLGIPVEDVYRRCIADIGGRTAVLSIRKVAYDDFRKAFERGHIGRNTMIIGEDAETFDIVITYGSSDYDTKQMSQLIDSIVQECHALDIETKDDEYINGLIADWEASHEK